MNQASEDRPDALSSRALTFPGRWFRRGLVSVLFAGLSLGLCHAAAPLTPAITPAAHSPALLIAAVSPGAHSQSVAKSKLQQSADNSEKTSPEGINEIQYLHSPMVHMLARGMGVSVDAASRGFELVNFLILLIAIIWGIAKYMPKTLRLRRERLQEELERARALTETANRRLAAVEERLSHLDSEIEAVRKQAEEETRIEEQRLRAAMEQEKQAILHSASEDIHAATRNMQNQLRKLAADLVVEHAARQIAVTAEIDRSIVDGFLRDVDRKASRKGTDA